MSACVFVGKIEGGNVVSIGSRDGLSADLFDLGVTLARSIQLGRGREVENVLLRDVFDSDDK